MSVKNFKITTGLDLDGLVLNVGAGNALYWNNDALATQTYVTDQISGINVDYASMAGSYIDWTSNQFNVNITDLVTELTGNQGIATETFVTGQGYLTAGDIPSFTTIASNMVFEQNAAVQSTYLSNPLGSLLDVNIMALATDLQDPGMVLEPLATQTYVNSQGFIGGHLVPDYVVGGSPALSQYLSKLNTGGPDFVDVNILALATELSTNQGFALTADAYIDANAVNAIANELISGGGIEYIGNTGFQVDTTVIATKAYVDAIAQGLDVKASVVLATTSNITIAPGIDYIKGVDLGQGVGLNAGDRLLVKAQSDPSQNGIYVVNTLGELERAADATVGTGGTLTKGAFTFVESGTNAGKGFVVSAIEPTPTNSIVWTQFSETGNYITSVGTNLDVTSGVLTVDLSSKQDALTAGTGIDITNGTISSTVVGLIETVDASFLVTDGELSLSDTISIASVELTDSVASVTAASDVFGNGSVSTYSMGSAVTVGTLPTGADVADVFITLKTAQGAFIHSRTSKLTYVNTGGDAPTWTEYGIINSGNFPATTISFDSSGNIIANVTGSDTYSVKGVVTILK